MGEWYGPREPKDIISAIESRLAAVERRIVTIEGGGGPGLQVVTFHATHTWLVGGAIEVPVGNDNVVPPFFVAENTGSEAVTLKRARYQLGAGGTATVKLTRNGADVSGYTGLTVSTTAAETSGDVGLSNNDLLQLVVTAVSSDPENLTFTLVLEHTTI